MAELNNAFERKNWLAYYAGETKVNMRVVIYSYTAVTYLLHFPLHPLFAERMREAEGDFSSVHAATCEELDVDYSMVSMQLQPA